MLEVIRNGTQGSYQRRLSMNQLVTTKDGKLSFVEGWSTTLENGKLHPNLEKYMAIVEEAIKVPVVCLGTGADREALCWRKEIKSFWE